MENFQTITAEKNRDILTRVFFFVHIGIYILIEYKNVVSILYGLEIFTSYHLIKSIAIKERRQNLLAVIIGNHYLIVNGTPAILFADLFAIAIMSIYYWYILIVISQMVIRRKNNHCSGLRVPAACKLVAALWNGVNLHVVGHFKRLNYLCFITILHHHFYFIGTVRRHISEGVFIHFIY